MPAEQQPYDHAVPDELPAWPVVLRSLRKAAGVTQSGWAAQLGLGRRTIQRWEQGEIAPDATGEAALIALCVNRDLCRPYHTGPLARSTITVTLLHRLLAEARQHDAVPDSGRDDKVATVASMKLRTNLQLPLTSFIGRNLELVDITRLLAGNRLLTLTGPGGTGKTRLALQVASGVLDDFADGIVAVDLSSVTDPELVPTVVAQVLGIQGLPGVPLRESVLRSLRRTQLLLLLDNYDQLLGAAEFAGAVLQTAPRVSLLVTSRSPLRIPGEQEHAVLPLPLPTEVPASLEMTAQNPAVALFVARAQAVRSDFTLTADNVGAVAEICTQLDGLPLAIELAAARVRVLPPLQMLARLTRRLPLLVDGARTVPARQRTLRNTIDWSYALLSPTEQRLFRRLAVFAGGCTIDSAAAVCNFAGELDVDLFEGLSALVEKSLLQVNARSTGDLRFTMLETIREYGFEQLEASGETYACQHAHTNFFTQLAEEAEPELLVGKRLSWYQRFDDDHGNLRAALQWCLRCDKAEAGLRLLGSLWSWCWRHLQEGRQWSEALLALPSAQLPSAARARALFTAALVAWGTGDMATAVRRGEEGVFLCRVTHDNSLLVMLLNVLSVSVTSFEHTNRLYDESYHLAEQSGSSWLRGWTQMNRAMVLAQRGDPAKAKVHAAAAVQHSQRGNDITLVSLSALTLTTAQLQLGEFEAAREHAVTCIAAFEETKNWRFSATAYVQLGIIDRMRGELQAASRAYTRSIIFCRDTGANADLSFGLEGVAAAAAAFGYAERAVYLLGAARAAHEVAPPAMVSTFEQLYSDTAAALRAALGEEKYQASCSAGYTQAVEQVITEALALADLVERA